VSAARPNRTTAVLFCGIGVRTLTVRGRRQLPPKPVPAPVVVERVHT
jgi:hypothetical protein